jgi:methylmalonyl-CoA mutase
MHSDFLTIFEGLGPEEWKSLIEKELKGQPYERLQTRSEAGALLQPFYTAEDTPTTSPLLWKPYGEETLLGEIFDLSEPQALEHLKKSLNGGCNAPELIFDHPDQIHAVLAFLHPSYVYTQLSADPELLLQVADRFAEAEGAKQGGLSLAFQHHSSFWTAKKHFTKRLPNWQFGYLAAQDSGTAEEKMLHLCQEYLVYLIKGQEQGYSLEALARGLSLRWKIGNDFLLETAQLRALQTLLSNLLEREGMTAGTLPFLDVSTQEQSLTQDKYLNMIRLTTQAVSAYSARVDRLALPASNFYEGNYSVFEKRISRNIHHLLLMEAGFDKGIDTLEGSYFFENVSWELAQRVWKQL